MIGLNNPFNIRNSKRNKWLGQIGSTKGFCNFSQLDFGVRAAVKIVMVNYRRFGIKTIRDIINRFAPPSENDSEDYVRFVVSRTQISPLRNLESEDQYVRVRTAMSQMEGNPVSPDVIFHVISKYNLKMSVFV